MSLVLPCDQRPQNKDPWSSEISKKLSTIFGAQVSLQNYYHGMTKFDMNFKITGWRFSLVIDFSNQLVNTSPQLIKMILKFKRYLIWIFPITNLLVIYPSNLKHACIPI